MRISRGEEFTFEEELKERWENYFDQLWNGDEMRGVRDDVRKGGNERFIRREVESRSR